MPEIPDIDRLIAEVAARHGILLKKDDAAFALVTLNQLVLESAIGDLVAQMRTATAEFEAAMERVQMRAGAAIATEIRKLVIDVGERPRDPSKTGCGSMDRVVAPVVPSNLLCAFVGGLVTGVFICWVW
jgi:hypothetical protein